MERLQRSVVDLESRVAAVKKSMKGREQLSPKELAERLVKGQLLAAEGDHERAAFVFFQLRENHVGSAAAITANYELGVSLAALGLPIWAIDCFTDNLRDQSPEGSRLHQRSLARLLELASPSSASGLAELPGMSATPERRARLEALGESLEPARRASRLGNEDIRRVLRWVAAVEPSLRSPELRYAHGHFLFLQGAYGAAAEELALINPDDAAQSLDRDDANGPFALRAAYLWAASKLVLGEEDEALQGFDRITLLNPEDDAQRRVVDLAWLAIGRIHHDAGRGVQAVTAYRGISRTSVFFPLALYETAWSMLLAGRQAGALEALELLQLYVTDADFSAEVQQLRGKVLIAQRDWVGAAEVFDELRLDFESRAESVRMAQLDHEGALAYYDAVAGDELREFALDALVPASALSVARSLPRAQQTEALAGELGHMDAELESLEELMSRMEDAVKSPQRTLLFSDLAAQSRSLDNVDAEIAELQMAVLARQSRGLFQAELRALEKAARRKLQEVEQPLIDGQARNDVRDQIDDIGEDIQRYGLVIDGMRATLVAIERQYAQTRARQQIDAQGFLNQAADMRTALKDAKADARALRATMIELRGSLRYNDPWSDQRRSSLEELSKLLDERWRLLGKFRRHAGYTRIWQRMVELRAALPELHQRLESLATARLQKAWILLAQEKRNLIDYRQESDRLQAEARDLVAHVVQATIPDVVDELENWVTRSKVGKLDIAHAIQEVEVEIMRSLEARRSTDLREIDRLLAESKRGRAR